jgi:hypothetical protein
MLYQKDFLEYTQRMVGDKSYDHLMIESLNSAIIDLVSSETPLILLPNLKTETTVVTDTHATEDSVVMPTNYLRHLFKVYSAAQNSDSIYIYPTKEKLMDQYSETIANGIVTGVAEEAGYLWYRNVPSTSDTLTLSYYKKPTEFAIGYNYSIDWLPYISTRKQQVLIGGKAAIYILSEIATDHRISADKREAAIGRATAISAEYAEAINDLYISTKDLREKASYRPARTHTFF